jgi:phage gpG-like protein
VATSNAAAEVAARLRVIAQRAEADAPLAAVKALAAAGETTVKLALTARSHSRGTRSPSQPGQPPARVSGKLSGGIHRTPAKAMGPGMAAQVLGSTMFYGAVHEFGPVTIRAKNFPQLGNPEAGFFGPQVKIPKRPWMKPSVDILVASGNGTRACATAWAASLFA